MSTRIAIIGAGNVGRALATSATRAGYQVTVSSSDPEDASQIASATGATVAPSNREAAAKAEIVILAVPVTAAGDARRRAVRRAGRQDRHRCLEPPDAEPDRRSPRPSRPDCRTPTWSRPSTPPSRRARPTPSSTASRPTPSWPGTMSSQGRRAGPRQAIGFRPIDAGGLEVSGTLEGMAWLNISLNMQNGWVWQDAWKLVGPTAAAA